MKPPRFVYHDPESLSEALSLLAEFGDEARVLAGGQSLVPILNFRLARPGHLIDINGISELAAIGTDDGIGLRVGAMVRQRALERSDVVLEHAPVVAQALPFVGHPQIRNRGTLGGSLAHADSAAELPAVMVALDAVFTLRSQHRQRTVAAADFFVGQLSTLLQPDEMLTEVHIPACPEQTGSSVMEVAVRRGDFALGGVVTLLTLNIGGSVGRARIVCFGVEERPLRQTEAEQSLEGAPAGEAAFGEAGRIVSARVESADDIHASAGYRRRLAGVLTRRTLAEALARVKQVAAA